MIVNGEEGSGENNNSNILEVIHPPCVFINATIQ